MNVPGMGMPPQNPQQQQQQQQQPPQPLDNISKIKSLMGPLRESLAVGNFVLITPIRLINFYSRIPLKLQHKH